MMQMRVRRNYPIKSVSKKKGGRLRRGSDASLASSPLWANVEHAKSDAHKLTTENKYINA